MRKWLRRAVLAGLCLAGVVFLLEQLPVPEKRAAAPPPPTASEKALVRGREVFDIWQDAEKRASLTLGAVAGAMKDLESIRTSDKHYATGRLAIEVLRPIREQLADEEIKRQAADTERKTQAIRERVVAEAKSVAEDADGRRAFAKDLEHQMLMKGMDASVRVSGAKATTLTVKYILISRPLVYQLGQGRFLTNMSKAGFQRVVFTDGYDKSWSYDLTK